MLPKIHLQIGSRHCKSCVPHQITRKYILGHASLGQHEGFANVQFTDAVGDCELHLYLCQAASSISVLRLGCALLWPHAFAAGLKFMKGE